MAPFTRLDAVALPIPRANVDTDQIAPARFLKRPRSAGLAPFLFHDTPEILARPGCEDARIVVAGRNFGCGSSREQAVWVLYDRGFRAAIAPSFGDIFANNALKNGFLTVALPEEAVGRILKGLPGRIAIDLQQQTVACAAGEFRFEIDPYRKRCLLEGTDELAYTLGQIDRVEAFEKGYRG